MATLLLVVEKYFFFTQLPYWKYWRATRAVTRFLCARGKEDNLRPPGCWSSHTFLRVPVLLTNDCWEKKKKKSSSSPKIMCCEQKKRPSHAFLRPSDDGARGRCLARHTLSTALRSTHKKFNKGIQAAFEIRCKIRNSQQLIFNTGSNNK